MTVLRSSATAEDLRWHPPIERRALHDLLLRPRYEVLPLPGTVDQVAEHVPASLPVTVTASPRRGLEPTLGVAEALARLGFSAVPHLAARLVYDEVHLAEILSRLDEADVRDMFVIAGDGDAPIGDYTDATQLITAIGRLRAAGNSRGPCSLGIAGYPEGHPLVPDAVLARALLAKAPMSSYVVTQMCFDAAAVDRWVRRTHGQGVRLPVHVGIAGAVDGARLLRVASRIGVGASTRFLRKHRGGTTLLRPGGYRPDRLLEELVTHDVHAGRAMAGLHVYTLGDVVTTERWRRELLDRLDEAALADG